MARIILIFSYNTDLDGTEFLFVHYVQQQLSGKALYLNPDAFPFSVAIYTPLYMYTFYEVCHFLKLDYINDIHSIYITGRIISFIAAITNLWFIDKLIRRYSSSTLFRLSFICIYLELITGHMYAIRPDCMKITFFTMFLYFYLDYFFYSGKKYKLILSLVSALLAISAKQDAIIYISLVQMMSILFLRTRNSILFFVIFTACTFFLIYVLNAAFGNYFMISIYNFNMQVISNTTKSYNFYVVIFNTIRLFPLYVLLIFVLLKYIPKTNFKLIKVISLTAFIAVFLSSSSMFRPGAFLNYTYELIILLLLCTALLLSVQPFSKRFSWIVYLYFVFLFISNYWLLSYSFDPPKESVYKQKFKIFYALRKQMLPLLKNNECLFALDLRTSIFFADKNVIYGQEYHLDRLIYALLGFKTTSKLLLNQSDRYDQYFKDGRVKYILAFDKEETRYVMKTYYPKYKLFLHPGEFAVYEFSNQ